MGRAFLFAAGIYLTTCGVSLLPVEKISLNWKPGHGQVGAAENASNQYVVSPPRWMPFSLMTVGSVAALYAIALPSRRKYQEA